MASPFELEAFRKPCPNLAEAIRRVGRLPDVKGPFRNMAVLEMLYLCYVEKVPKEDIAVIYGCNDRKTRSMAYKIMATNEGDESSRKPDIRRIFFEFCEREGIQVTRGKCPSKKPSKRGHPAHREGIKPLLEGFE